MLSFVGGAGIDVAAGDNGWFRSPALPVGSMTVMVASTRAA
jgi:hypothetical protein